MKIFICNSISSGNQCKHHYCFFNFFQFCLTNFCSMRRFSLLLTILLSLSGSRQQASYSLSCTYSIFFTLYVQHILYPVYPVRTAYSLLCTYSLFFTLYVQHILYPVYPVRTAYSLLCTYSIFFTLYVPHILYCVRTAYSLPRTYSIFCTLYVRKVPDQLHSNIMK